MKIKNELNNFMSFILVRIKNSLRKLIRNTHTVPIYISFYILYIYNIYTIYIIALIITDFFYLSQNFKKFSIFKIFFYSHDW